MSFPESEKTQGKIGRANRLVSYLSLLCPSLKDYTVQLAGIVFSIIRTQYDAPWPRIASLNL